MAQKNRFCSLNRKIMIFGIFLSSFFLLFCILFWGSNRYLFEQQRRLLEVQQQFSALINGMREADSSLYAYAQARSEALKAQCESFVSGIQNAAHQLSEFLDQPIFVDLDYLTQTYAESAHRVLDAQGAGTGQFLRLYQESAENLEIINALITPYTMAVNENQAQGQERLERIREIMEYSMIAAIVCLTGVSLLFLTGFSRRITRNLEFLTKRAEKICEGEWNVEMPAQIEIRDEVGVLAKAFYRMLDTIHRQIEQLKRQEAMKRQLKEAEMYAVQMKARLEHAQLRTLQSRVNPHFLFNALNVIGGQAAEEKAEKTLDMIFETADYLRYSLSKLDKIVTLEEEIKNAGDYLMIQKRRFADRLSFSLKCDDGCKKAKIPSMILQPLCENALMHGIMPLTEGGWIEVSAKKRAGWIEVTVADNGLGFSAERIAEIEERLKKEEYDDANGVGMYNIMQRMNAFFQDKARCAIESVPNVETKVIVTFPAYEKAETQMEEDERDDKGNFGG